MDEHTGEDKGHVKEVDEIISELDKKEEVKPVMKKSIREIGREEEE